MNYSCAQLKQMAKQRMRGNYPNAVLIMLIIGVASSILYTLVSAILGFGNFAYIFGGYTGYYHSFRSAILSLISFMLIIVILSVFEAGNTRFYYNVATGRPSSVEDVLFAFRNNPLKALGIQCLLVLIAVACLIPFYIVLFIGAFSQSEGVILLSFVVLIGSMTAEFMLMLSFSQAIYIYVQNPEIGVIEALRESYRMMRGNRASLLYMNLSFIPMVLLISITCGIASLYVTPYMSATQVLFYLQVSGQLPPEGPFEGNGGFYQQNPYNNNVPPYQGPYNQGGQYPNQGPYNQGGQYPNQGPYNQGGQYPNQGPYNQGGQYPNQGPYNQGEQGQQHPNQGPFNQGEQGQQHPNQGSFNQENQNGQHPNQGSFNPGNQGQQQPDSNAGENNGQNQNNPYDLNNQESSKKTNNGQGLDGYENPYKDNYYN